MGVPKKRRKVPQNGRFSKVFPSILAMLLAGITFFYQYFTNQFLPEGEKELRRNEKREGHETGGIENHETTPSGIEDRSSFAYTLEVINEFPHQETDYTQGLLYTFPKSGETLPRAVVEQF